MTASLSYFAKVAPDGTFEGLPKKKFRKEVLSLFAGKQIEIIIHQKKKHRSINQNNYYWLILTMIADYTGFTKEESHEVMKMKFLKTQKVHEDSGLVFDYVKSTTELTTVEMEEYLEQIRRLAAEDFGMNIPLPNEQVDIFS